jgi:hypothetical protein
MPTVKTIKIIIAALLIGFFLSIQHSALAQSANEAWQLNSRATELFKGGHYSEAEPLAISTVIGGNIASAIVAIAVLIVASVLLQRWAAVRKEKRIQESLLKKVYVAMQEHLPALVRKRMQLVQTNAYGNQKLEKWTEEIRYFLFEHLGPSLSPEELVILPENFAALMLAIDSVVQGAMRDHPSFRAFSDDMSPAEFEGFCAEELRNLDAMLPPSISYRAPPILVGRRDPLLARGRKTIIGEETNNLENLLSILASSSAAANRAPTNFDRARWDALLKRDPQLAMVANKLRPLGPKWVDKFAASYLAINDRNHLPTLVNEIIADARKEFEQQQTARGR